MCLKKILTAINNPIVYEHIKKEEFELINENILYREGILELLEKNNNLDLILISENIPGEIKFIDLLNRIKIINNKIKIIVILENNNFELENKLKEIPVFKIYLNNNITVNELIEDIKDKKLNPQEELKKEINELKKLIKQSNEKNKYLEEIHNNKINKLNNKVLNKIIIKIKRIVSKENKLNSNKKIIAFFGDRKVGKTIFAINCLGYLKKENKKTCLIDINENNNISLILEIENKNKIVNNNKTKIIIYDKNIINDLSNFIRKLKKDYEYILLDIGTENKEHLNKIYNVVDELNFLIEPNLIHLEFLINNIKLILNNSREKLNIIINKKNKYSIDKKIIEGNLNNKFKLKELNYNNKYEKYINDKRNKFNNKIINVIFN